MRRRLWNLLGRDAYELIDKEGKPLPRPRNIATLRKFWAWFYFLCFVPIMCFVYFYLLLHFLDHVIYEISIYLSYIWLTKFYAYHNHGLQCLFCWNIYTNNSIMHNTRILNKLRPYTGQQKLKHKTLTLFQVKQSPSSDLGRQSSNSDLSKQSFGPIPIPSGV